MTHHERGQFPMTMLATQQSIDDTAMRIRIDAAIRQSSNQRKLGPQVGHQSPSRQRPTIPHQLLPTDERQQRLHAAERFFARPVTPERMRRLNKEQAEMLRSMAIVDAEQARIEALATDRVTYAFEASKLLVGTLRRYLHTERGRQTMEEVRLDSIARTLKGKEPYDLIRETVRRVLPIVRYQVSEEVQRRFRTHRPITPDPPGPSGHSSTRSRGRS